MIKRMPCLAESLRCVAKLNIGNMWAVSHSNFRVSFMQLCLITDSRRKVLWSGVCHFSLLQSSVANALQWNKYKWRSELNSESRQSIALCVVIPILNLSHSTTFWIKARITSHEAAASIKYVKMKRRKFILSFFSLSFSSSVPSFY